MTRQTKSESKIIKTLQGDDPADKIRIQNYQTMQGDDPAYGSWSESESKIMKAIRLCDGKPRLTHERAQGPPKFRIISAFLACHDFAQNYGEPKAPVQSHNIGPCTKVESKRRIRIQNPQMRAKRGEENQNPKFAASFGRSKRRIQNPESDCPRGKRGREENPESKICVTLFETTIDNEKNQKSEFVPKGESAQEVGRIQNPESKEPPLRF